jgi:RNA polymerase sigma-70 factor (ECF subfamily)
MASVIAEMETCIPALWRYASALVRDHQEVDDLVHDCLVLALDRLHTFRDNLRAWLLTILHNDRHRGAPSHRPTDLANEEAADQAALGKCGCQDDHIHVDDLMPALGRLPEEQRSVLLLVAVEDLSYAEVADVIGVPIGTVMSGLSRAREKLRHEERETPRSVLRRVK